MVVKLADNPTQMFHLPCQQALKEKKKKYIIDSDADIRFFFFSKKKLLPLVIKFYKWDDYVQSSVGTR